MAKNDKSSFISDLKQAVPTFESQMDLDPVLLQDVLPGFCNLVYNLLNLPCQYIWLYVYPTFVNIFVFFF